jgi:hypothetical protein
MSEKRKYECVDGSAKEQPQFLLEYGMSHYSIVPSILSNDEIEELRCEADQLMTNFTQSSRELADNGCAFDTMEDGVNPSSSVKVNLDDYISARFEGQLCGSNMDGQQIFKRIVTGPLTRIAKLLLKQDEVYLFNEHFVIKPPKSSGKSKRYNVHINHDYLSCFKKCECSIRC